MSRPAFTSTLIALTLAAIAAQATPADPHIKFGAQAAGIPITPVDAFNFHANPNGGGVFNFQNVSPNVWVGVDLIVTLPTGDPISVTTPVAFFSTFTVVSTPIKTDPNLSVYKISFDDPKTDGITPGTIFSLDFNDDPNAGQNGSGGWGKDNAFTAGTTLATPEPASFLLLGCGILLLAAMRRLRAAHKI